MNALIVPGAVHIWVKTLPATTLMPNAGTKQPLYPFALNTQLSGPYAAISFFNGSGQFAPPVKGIWHFDVWVRVSLPSTAQNISATFRVNATDGSTNMISTTTIPCTGTAIDQGMNLTGTALLGPTDYVNLFMYYAGTGTCTTDNNNGLSSFYASLIQRTA